MQGSRGSQSVVEALEVFSRGLDSLLSSDKSHANDCHDEQGKFCEGGGSSSGGGKSKPRNGISPQASIHTAEKRGKEYGYAKKVSFYQCTSVDQANEINAQLAELSDDTGIVLERVYVYKGGGKSKEAPKNAAAYHSGWAETIGIQDGNTAEYCFKNAPYPEGKQEANAKWFFEYADKMKHEHETGQREKVDPEIVKAFRRQGEEALKYKDYAAHTEPGNGVRNPTIDHEFAHALVDRAVKSGPNTNAAGYSHKAVERLNTFAGECVSFCEEEKFSVYAVTGMDANRVPRGEAIAETYAHWKAGKTVPTKIATGLRRLETYRGQGTGT
jgi:hypothetical protein